MVLAGVQVGVLNVAQSANLEAPWWQYLLLVVIAHAIWQLIQLVSYVYDQLPYGTTSAVRVLLVITPAILFTLGCLYGWGNSHQAVAGSDCVAAGA